MRISELSGKEVIDISNGVHLDTINNCDFYLDEGGRILSLVLPRRSDVISFWSDRRQRVIAWEKVKRIGNEIMLVECSIKEEGLEKDT